MAEALLSDKAPPVAGGEFAFTWADFRELAALVHGESGIVLTENKANLVYSRLAKRLRAIGLSSFRDYCALVTSEDGIDERQAMIAAMTTNVTRLFREPHHFDHLAEVALPPLVEKARRGGKVRLWSAACSSGEEPYSIASTLLSVMPDAGDHDILILASDIDHHMLARAEAGEYPVERVGDIPVAMRGRCLEPKRDGAGAFRFNAAIRNLVRFRQLNLLKSWPLRAAFDVIFCRNVMIYFDQETQNDIWLRFSRQMAPGGFLYIGHSERIGLEPCPFDLVGQTTYRLGGAAP